MLEQSFGLYREWIQSNLFYLAIRIYSQPSGWLQQVLNCRRKEDSRIGHDQEQDKLAISRCLGGDVMGQGDPGGPVSDGASPCLSRGNMLDGQNIYVKGKRPFNIPPTSKEQLP
jgi:hypothetical protein